MPNSPQDANLKAAYSCFRIGKLGTPMQVATELGRVYKAARRGELDTIDAARLASILSALRVALESCALEARVERLERGWPSDTVPLRRPA